VSASHVSGLLVSKAITDGGQCHVARIYCAMPFPGDASTGVMDLVGLFYKLQIT
jgi:hypothetical protein